jgi:hypothetical protein
MHLPHFGKWKRVIFLSDRTDVVDMVEITLTPALIEPRSIQAIKDLLLYRFIIKHPDRLTKQQVHHIYRGVNPASPVYQTVVDEMSKCLNKEVIDTLLGRDFLHEMNWRMFSTLNRKGPVKFSDIMVPSAAALQF